MDHLKEATRIPNVKPTLTVLEVNIIILGSLLFGDCETASSDSLSSKDGKLSGFVDQEFLGSRCHVRGQFDRS